MIQTTLPMKQTNFAIFTSFKYVPLFKVVVNALWCLLPRFSRFSLAAEFKVNYLCPCDPTEFIACFTKSLNLVSHQSSAANCSVFLIAVQSLTTLTPPFFLGGGEKTPKSDKKQKKCFPSEHAAPMSVKSKRNRCKTVRRSRAWKNWSELSNLRPSHRERVSERAISVFPVPGRWPAVSARSCAPASRKNFDWHLLRRDQIQIRRQTRKLYAISLNSLKVPFISTRNFARENKTNGESRVKRTKKPAIRILSIKIKLSVPGLNARIDQVPLLSF